MLSELYYKSPYFLKVGLASLKGAYLNRQRYCKRTERWIEEAKERESWANEKWTKWQEEKLETILDYAAKKVPYYRNYWLSRRQAGDSSSWSYIENWPILEKEELRKNPRAFLSEQTNPKKMIHLRTSGTTGTPLDLWWSLENSRRWYALFELRWRRWHGISRFDRWGNLGGQLVTKVTRKKPPFWVWNQPMRQLYLSSYHLTPQNVKAYINAIEDHRLKYLWGYTSSLYFLAGEVLRQGLAASDLKMIGTEAETLFDYQKRVIENAFQCPVIETYGMGEQVAAAGECGCGKLHLWPEAGYLEVDRKNNLLVTDGAGGDLIGTSLFNKDMLFIRYRVGDRIVLGSEDAVCSCGRTLPLIESIQGRTDDILYSASGASVGRLSHIPKELPVREMQFVQDSIDTIKVRYAPTNEWDSASENEVRKKLIERLGEMNIIFERYSSIPRGSNGKLRLTVCKIPKEERPDQRKNTGG